MSESSKEKIIIAANKLFAEKGYDATSIRDISAKAKVNLASINYYFGSKKGLFETLVAEFTNQKFLLVVSILEPPKTAEEFRLRLSLYVRQFLALSHNERDAFRMMNKNIEDFAQLSPELFEQTFMKIHEQFTNFVEEAQKQNIIRSEFKIEFVTQILFGTLIDLVRGNEIRKRFTCIDMEKEEYTDNYIKTFLEIFLNGVGVNN